MGQSGKIVIMITTHRRPKWCLNLLKELKKESKGLNYEIHLIHDKCDSDYSRVVNYCKRNNIKYWRTKENFGKLRFWELHNLIYQLLDTMQYDYFIQLIDDITLVKDFTRRAISTLKHFNVCKLSFFYVYNKKDCIEKTINGIDYKELDWIDCAYAARPDLLKGFRLEKPILDRKRFRGSGVAHAFKKSYRRKKGGDKRMWSLSCSLWEHLGWIDSVMHENRRREACYNKPSEIGDPLRSVLADEDRKYIQKKFNKIMNNG